ncbi:hypothetical protein E2C01_020745 [Portunus trituberculatus]|uniref:Uncharacterized protein n=1 Tax=Portunus trituberculatus TaxID=210409 RepID=A0A5B7E0Z9_PORTR|nr:hypothetical protein [Portunus trituberculatus]
MRALGPRGLQAHGFESCPRSECRLGFLTLERCPRIDLTDLPLSTLHSPTTRRCRVTSVIPRCQTSAVSTHTTLRPHKPPRHPLFHRHAISFHTILHTVSPSSVIYSSLLTLKYDAPPATCIPPNPVSATQQASVQ